MDSLEKWHVHIVDLRSLFSEWERRRVAGHRWTKRFREIHSNCMFTLCLEHRTEQRYLVGLPGRGDPQGTGRVAQLFDDCFGEVEDVDFVLLDDPKGYGPSSLLHHRSQMFSYLNQPSTTEVHLVQFLEKRKLRVTPDEDLRLVIHVEQPGHFNFHFLWADLTHRKPKCPFSQVFAFGQTADNPRKRTCYMIYPDLALLPELDEVSAKALLVDREQYSKGWTEQAAQPGNPSNAG